MRRFFSFRSSSSSGGKSDAKSTVSGDENVFWDSNRETAPRNSVSADATAKSGSPLLRRSLSFSSTPYSRDFEGRHTYADSPIRSSLSSPEKFRKSPESSPAPSKCRITVLEGDQRERRMPSSSTRPPKNRHIPPQPTATCHVASTNYPYMTDDILDAELLLKLSQVQERITRLPEFSWESISRENFTKVLRKISEERNTLASELSLQLRTRISERASAREALKQAKRDLDTRTRRLEKEKEEIQLTLEREIDRRSVDWSTKLEKFQGEEQRLRERVRELAEQNVSLQRELSSLSRKKSTAETQVNDLQSKLTEVSGWLDERVNENEALKESFSLLQAQLDERETLLESTKRSYEDSEIELEDLKKIVSKLHMTCTNQEKTIEALTESQRYGELTGQRGENELQKLKMENFRLAGVEKRLRNEVESLEVKVEQLRREKEGNLYSGIDKELHAQMEVLKREVFSLLNEGDDICEKLIRRWSYDASMERGFDGYTIAEHSMKLQGLRRAVEIFRERMESTAWALEERVKLDDEVGQLGMTIEREVRVEMKLRAEALMVSMMREKLVHKDLEVEMLRGEMGSLVREREGIHAEIVSLRDEASSLMHKMRDKEHQVARSEESLGRLREELHECKKELAVLPRISRERDCLWEEVKQCREMNMQLDYEVKAMKKKVEALEEEILIKEGQISILKDSLGKQMV